MEKQFDVEGERSERIWRGSFDNQLTVFVTREKVDMGVKHTVRWDDVTKYIDGQNLPSDCAYVYKRDKWPEFLQKHDLAVPTGESRKEGGYEYEVFRFKLDRIEPYSIY